jgi:hypothetical protein
MELFLVGNCSYSCNIDGECCNCLFLTDRPAVYVMIDKNCAGIIIHTNFSNNNSGVNIAGLINLKVSKSAPATAMQALGRERMCSLTHS